MAKLQIDLSGKGGLCPRFWGDYDRTVATPENRIIGAPDQMADGIYNPFRIYGYMSAANGTATNLTYTGGTHDNMATSSLYDVTNDDFYFGERGQQLWKGDTLDDLQLSLSVDLGVNNTIHDLEIYEINGSKKMFVIYDKNGTMDIAISDLPYNSATDNPTWLTGTVSGKFSNTLTNEAFMRNADNGFAYLFQDNNIHKIDGTSDGGTDGTVSANILQFPGYFQCIDAVDYRGNMYTAIHQNTETIIGVGPSLRTNTIKCGVYIWDRLTSIIRTRDFISLEGVKQIRKIFISPAGDVRVIVVNAENITEIRKFNGQTFVPVVEAGYLSYPEYHDSVVNVNGLTIWLGYDGLIYAHGKISPFDKEAIYKISSPITILNSVGPRTGAILFGGANADSSTIGEKKFKTGLYYGWTSSDPGSVISELDIYGTGADGVNASQNTGNVYTLVKYLPQMSTVNYIDIYMLNRNDTGVDTEEAKLKIYFNGSTAEWASKSIRRDSARRGYQSIDVNKPFINSIQLEIEWNTSAGVSTTGFAPSMAIVDYSLTNTKG